jgi:hypothetical protein
VRYELYHTVTVKLVSIPVWGKGDKYYCKYVKKCAKTIHTKKGEHHGPVNGASNLVAPF